MDDGSTRDYLGYIDDLRWALDLPEVREAMRRSRPLSADDYARHWQTVLSDAKILQNMSAPYWLVSTLGFCRLFNVALPRELAAAVQGPLPVEVVAPALHGLIHAIEHLKIDAQQLPEKFDDAEPVEDVALCTSILHQLMQTWAAFIVFDENYQEYLDTGGPRSGAFSKLMDRVLAAFEDVDDVTQREEQLQLLSVAAELPLLENWRKTLQGPFKETLPWWLDGTLERIAACENGDKGRTREASTEPRQRRALSALLFLRHGDVTVRQDEYPLAASSGRQHRALAEEKRLLETDWPVAGDLQVTVRFWRNVDTRSCKQYSLELVGAMHFTNQYVSAEIEFPDGTVRSSSFSLGVAAFDFGPGDLQADVSAALINAHGERRTVLLGENRNGGQ